MPSPPPSDDDDERLAKRFLAMLFRRAGIWVLAGGGLGLGGWGTIRANGAAAPVNACAAEVEKHSREITHLRRQIWRLQDSALIRRGSEEWSAREAREEIGRDQGPERPVKLPRMTP
jgi:hypothetical protein